MKKINYLISAAYLCGLIVLWLTPFWPWRFWWLANAIQISPLWIWGVPLIFLFLSDILRRNRNLFILHGLSFLILFFGIMGYKLPSSSPSGKEELYLNVLTVNLGEGGDVNNLSQYIRKVKPDIIALQEVEHHERALIKRILPNEWNAVFNEHLGVASRFKIKDFETKNRRFLGDWGGVTGRAELNAGVMGVINFFTVHLDSPREGLEAILRDRLNGIDEMRRVTEDQVAESILAAKWAGTFSNVIVAGDFNMLDSNPVYQKYWSKFKNAFSIKGSGFGYTKHTRWHGVRIDHILSDKNWKVLSAQTGGSLGGDHYPVSARFAFTGQVLKEPLSDEEDSPRFSPEEKIFIFEGFDENAGEFYKYSDAELSVDRQEKYKHGKSLKIQSKALQSHIAAGVNLARMPIDQFMNLSFVYKIPDGMPVGMRVKTQFDDWICIGGTPSDLCPHPRAREGSPVLTNDGQWHEVAIDIKSAVRSVLPAVKYIKEFQFYVHQTNSLYDQFWIDDFLIKD